MEPTRDDRTLVLQPIDKLQQSSLPGDDIVIELDRLPAGSAVLVFRNGPDAGLVVELRGSLVRAGRHEDADLFLDDVTVSRNHVEIHRVAGGYEARDAGSLNGTYINHKRVESAMLRHGDDLQIGKFHLTFLTGGSR
jgi:pSer/pThr/pTyr-binding forkhead associated (FHA) protein